MGLSIVGRSDCTDVAKGVP